MWYSPMNWKAVSKYCLRFWWPVSAAGRWQQVTPSPRLGGGTPGEAVTLSTRFTPRARRVSGSAASLALPTYSQGRTREAG